MTTNKIELPDINTLKNVDLGDWVCYFKGNRSNAKKFDKLLKDSGIISFGASNYTDVKKVYYVTKRGDVFSIDRKKFDDCKKKIITLSQYISDQIIGKSLEYQINNSYEITF